MKYIALFGAFFLLTACAEQNNAELATNTVTSQPKRLSSSPQVQPVVSHTQYTQRDDGIPTGPLPTQFKKVVPHAEPMSHYGNPASYKVAGKTYRVLTSASGYRARGLASWYGTKFHEKRTSSGEDYNLYELTAAHKTLPLPTYVRVKNLNNGREVIVKVNDRGPFHEGRIIDLSYGAAVKLGVYPRGTAPVEIEALTTNTGNPHYYLQAGAFKTKGTADSLKKQLAKETPSPVFIEKYQQYYLVKVGPFANKAMSDGLKSTLAKKGIHGAFSMLQTG